MKGKIADSIIIKVGHGIMEIPRKQTQVKEPEFHPDSRTLTCNPTRQSSTVQSEAVYRDERDNIL